MPVGRLAAPHFVLQDLISSPRFLLLLPPGSRTSPLAPPSKIPCSTGAPLQSDTAPERKMLDSTVVSNRLHFCSQSLSRRERFRFSLQDDFLCGCAPAVRGTPTHESVFKKAWSTGILKTGVLGSRGVGGDRTDLRHGVRRDPRGLCGRC